ncbi:hypothetical protein M9Y10_025296 [Tritrichomonas musculus]|uniref:Beta-lactamase n=1 Tax=Tritrichomonas musculus TaxID=1915356 RepID=A0ABR2HA39_9EUKA
MELIQLSLLFSVLFLFKKYKRIILSCLEDEIDTPTYIDYLYLSNKYVPLDVNKAIYYLSFSSNKGDPEAQFNLGVIFSSGQYTTVDISRAIHYYSLAADQNQTDALFNLGLIYHEGKYVKRDIEKAIYYYKRAADLNKRYNKYSFVY